MKNQVLTPYPGFPNGVDNSYGLLNFKGNLETGSPEFQEIHFYELAEDGVSYINGTTVEEMLKISLLRLKDLNSRFPSRENSLAVTKIEEALHWLNARTQDRIERGVEGKLLA